jgi:hypothetical protein
MTGTDAIGVVAAPLGRSRAAGFFATLLAAAVLAIVVA